MVERFRVAWGNGNEVEETMNEVAGKVSKIHGVVGTEKFLFVVMELRRSGKKKNKKVV